MKHSERFVGVPVTLNNLIHPDLKPEYVLVYISIRSFVALSPRKSNFCYCFPGIATIAKKFALDEDSVHEGITWLEVKGYIYRQPRGRRSITYTIVRDHDRFLRIRETEGPEQAIQDYEDSLEEQRNPVRRRSRRSLQPVDQETSTTDLDQEQPN